MSKLLRLEAVRELTGLSRSTIYADPSFPRRVKIGQRAVGWVAAEVEAWIEAKLLDREAA